MSDRSVGPEADAGWRVIDIAVSCACRQLGDGLLSAYAIGSLAHGGFRVAISDVDLALLTDDQPDRVMSGILKTIQSEVAGSDQTLGARLSVFHSPWSVFSDPPAEARFPAIDRYDLVRYGVLVYGTDLRPAHGAAPGAEDLRAQAVESALRRVTPEQLAEDLHGLERGGVFVRDATKIVLWPVRLQHVCDTGEATGNANAVQHYLDLPDAEHRALVSDALAWRDASAIEDPPAALDRIRSEIHDLHAEVFRRLAKHPHTPRRDELEIRSDQLSR